MDGTLRILHLEDDPMDAEIVRNILRRETAECEITCVDNRADFERALETAAFDLVLSDFSGPDFDGLTSLRLSRQKLPDAPFIFVSGSIGEDAAIDSLLGGATDYVLKQRLKRLGPAVARAFREAKERKERKLLEEKFHQAQKMEVVGRLAGGIAHDFNNLLAVILGHLELLMARKDADPRLQDSLLDIHKAAESAGSLTRQLLLFSRQQSLATRALDVNPVLAAMARLLGRVLGGNIRLKSHTPPESLIVNADPGMLEQVIMNLVINARDAMPDGGRIDIRAGRIELEAGSDDEAGRSGSFVLLSVTDSGAGIPPEVLPRIFDPFFTTKEPGKGTGLGLATVYGIVQQHQGWIDVRSTAGEGTEFRIFLPECPDPIPDAAAAPVASAPATLLVVDGDARQRKQARIFLEEQGYKVIEAATGAEALEIAGNGAVPQLDLLLADVMTADGMPGRELAERLAAKHPDLKVIFASRYGLDPAEAGSSEEFLLKPYAWQALQEAVRRRLEAGRERAGKDAAK